ncbi:MAG: tRNA 2-selenouridine(34) synthase MnmH, partial [Spirochaetota bacterium]
MDQYELAEDFLRAGETLPIADVRSPSEFAHGHIPGAVNIPLFTDEERALIGTTYVQIGHQQAVDLGADIALPKAAWLVAEARKVAVERKLLVHCWRGGMRSGSASALFNLAGLEAATLKGGYKAYRRLVHESFEKKVRLVIVGGFTGTGKSEILSILREKGEQVLDLEGLAHHKGSVFGGIGRIQPTTEQFENDLYAVWSAFNPDRRIYAEDESLRIGSNTIPETIFSKIKEAPLIVLELPREQRLARIIAEYGYLDKNELISAAAKIRKRMGLERSQKIEDA